MRHVESHVFCFVFFKEEIKSFVKLWPYVVIFPWYMFVQCFSTVSENSENIYKSSLSMIHTPSYLQITLTWAKKPGSNHQLVVNPLYFYFWMSENILTKIELKTHRFLKTQQEKLVPKWHFFEPNLRQNVWIIPCFYSQDAPTLAQSKTMLKNTFFNAFYTITEFLGLHFNLTHKKNQHQEGTNSLELAAKRTCGVWPVELSYHGLMMQHDYSDNVRPISPDLLFQLHT